MVYVSLGGACEAGLLSLGVNPLLIKATIVFIEALQLHSLL
jgi:hypothetical protein